MPSISALPDRADRTPERPDQRVAPPPVRLQMRVKPETCHLANPLLAVQGMLASEAGLFAHVDGDVDEFEVHVALPSPADASTAEAWVRWVLHCAGVRGTAERVDR